MALTNATQEALFLEMLLKDFGFDTHRPISISGDNKGSIDLSKNSSSNDRSKHIDIKHHFVREKYSEGIINFHHVPTDENVADLFTKPATKPKLIKFQQLLFGH